jgi:hypothetical protein
MVIAEKLCSVEHPAMRLGEYARLICIRISLCQKFLMVRIQWIFFTKAAVIDRTF